MPRRKILRTPQRYLEPRTAIQLPTAAQLCVRAVTQGAMDKIDEAAAQLPHVSPPSQQLDSSQTNSAFQFRRSR
jgi:hypothetical protein